MYTRKNDTFRLSSIAVGDKLFEKVWKLIVKLLLGSLLERYESYFKYSKGF